MATVFESIPSAFWAALNNQNLSEMLPPRWSILVNDSGVQCTLYWESSEAAPPSPPPSPDATTPNQGALPVNIRNKRHATQQINDFQNELLFKYQSPELQIPMTPKRARPNPSAHRPPSFSSAFNLPSALTSRAPLAIPINPNTLSMEGMKKFDVGDISIDPILANRNALNNLQEAIQTQLQNRGNIIRLNPSSKPSTPGTEPTPPTPKSVIQLSSDLSNKENTQNQSENTVTINKSISPSPQENCSRRDSVVAENTQATAAPSNNQHCQPSNVTEIENNGNLNTPSISSSSAIVLPSSSESGPFHPHHAIRQISNEIDNISDGDVDDMNLEDIVKQQEKMEQSIPSSVPSGNGVISSQVSVIDGGLSSSEGRNDIIHQREPIMPKQEDIDSDCEVIGDDTNGTSKSLPMRSVVRPPLSFETPLQRPMNQLSIPSFALSSDNASRNQPSSQVEVIYTGEHGGGYQVSTPGYCAATAAAQNAANAVVQAQQSSAAFSIELSHAAQSRLDHLRREAETGQLSVTSFIRRACKVFFSMEEVSRGGIGLLDEKKLDMILAESRRFYPEKANESLVRRTISTYVCQTRGQMRAQENHTIAQMDRRLSYGRVLPVAAHGHPAYEQRTAIAASFLPAQRTFQANRF